MTLEELMVEISTVVRDDSLAEKFPGWINNAISELAADFDLPALRLIEPVPLEITENTWLYDVPDSYQKHLFRARNGGYGRVQITRDLDDLHRKDIAHTQVGEKVTSVGVRDRKIGVFIPMIKPVKSLVLTRPTRDDLRDLFLTRNGQPGGVDIGAV